MITLDNQSDSRDSHLVAWLEALLLHRVTDEDWAFPIPIISQAVVKMIYLCM